jgi:hypothetical protein
MEVIVAISITPQSQPPIAPQDPTLNQGAAPAPAPSASAFDGTSEVSQSQPTADQIAAHAGLVAQANQTIQSGQASHPDLNGEGARLLALHVQQQLSAHGQSIANQAPQALLSLLR